MDCCASRAASVTPLARAFYAESPYPREFVGPGGETPGGVEGFVEWALAEARGLLDDDVGGGQWKLEHDKVGRCNLTASTPVVLKAPLVSALETKW